MYSQIDFNAGSNFYLNLYCFILYCFLVLISLRGNTGMIKRDSDNMQTILLFCGITLFALTSFINDDFFHYYENMADYKNGVIEDELMGLEMPYQYIIYYFSGNYFLFRLTVWGSSLLLVVLCSRIYGTSAYSTIFLILVGFIIIFSYARATLAMSLYTLGAIIICKSSEHRGALHTKLIGLGIMVLSFYFHRSMLPVIVSTILLILLPYKRSFARLSLYLFPIMVFVFSLLIREAFDEFTLIANTTMDDETGIFRKMEYYTEETTAKSNFYGYISLTLKYSTFYIPLLLIAITLQSSEIVKYVKTRCIYLYLFTYFIVVIATSMLFTGINNDVLFYRYLFMSFIPLCILTSYLRQNKILSVRHYNIIVTCFIISNLFQLFAAVYAN